MKQRNEMMLKKGALTGLELTNGTPVRAGDTLIDDNGRLWDVNRFCQAVPKDDGKAVPLSEFKRKNPGADRVTGDNPPKALDIIDEPEDIEVDRILEDVKAMKKEQDGYLTKIAELEAKNKQLREEKERLFKNMDDAQAFYEAELQKALENAMKAHNEVAEAQRLCEQYAAKNNALNGKWEDQQLADELRRRGWTVTATRTITQEL